MVPCLKMTTVNRSRAVSLRHRQHAIAAMVKLEDPRVQNEKKVF